jgi:hypothetical protein
MQSNLGEKVQDLRKEGGLETNLLSSGHKSPLKPNFRSLTLELAGQFEQLISEKSQDSEHEMKVDLPPTPDHDLPSSKFLF